MSASTALILLFSGRNRRLLLVFQTVKPKPEPVLGYLVVEILDKVEILEGRLDWLWH